MDAFHLLSGGALLLCVGRLWRQCRARISCHMPDQTRVSGVALEECACTLPRCPLAMVVPGLASCAVLSNKRTTCKCQACKSACGEKACCSRRERERDGKILICQMFSVHRILNEQSSP
jgi:hypothetical protein